MNSIIITHDNPALPIIAQAFAADTTHLQFAELTFMPDDRLFVSFNYDKCEVFKTYHYVYESGGNQGRGSA